MHIVRKQPTAKGPAEMFTGDVWLDPVARGPEPSHLSMASVHFTPGAHTAWHSHEGGQTLYVLEGRGLVQSRGHGIVEIRPGDVISTPDGEEHWHGAAPDNFMTHLTITEGGAHWGAHVTDAEYHPEG
jgi:quercetin dioxygenase-like cupin family protein